MQPINTNVCIFNEETFKQASRLWDEASYIFCYYSYIFVVADSTAIWTFLTSIVYLYNFIFLYNFNIFVYPYNIHIIFTSYHIFYRILIIFFVLYNYVMFNVVRFRLGNELRYHKYVVIKKFHMMVWGYSIKTACQVSLPVQVYEREKRVPVLFHYQIMLCYDLFHFRALPRKYNYLNY